ncbi:MAG TPA: PEP-CTERM sorting domain-containing protein, partial [Gammaproteobacteria bacterium]|nr:PEP-CTERM sorting domain-containing protein [Gammaproteobacteria bacterium]
MNTRTLLIASALLTASLISGAAQAALYDRGGGLIYDDVLNVTWLQDANYAKTSGHNSEGRMVWGDATSWADNLSYYDSVRDVTYDDWRLPKVSPVNGVNFNYDYSFDGSTDVGHNITSISSELSYMFYINLGNSYVAGDCSASPGTCLNNTGPFMNLFSELYWSGTEYKPGTNHGWLFYMPIGVQGGYVEDNFPYYAWAVRDGDVAAVPEASTYVMMLAGLGLVGAMARRRKIVK